MGRERVPDDINELSEEWYQRLRDGFDTLIDSLFDELQTVSEASDRGDEASFQFAYKLPVLWRRRANPGFLRKLIIAAGNLSRQAVYGWDRPGCLAEEMLVLWLMDEIEIHADMFGTELPRGDWRGDLVALLMPDEDISHLYNPAHDGIDQSDAGRFLGIPGLGFEDAFTPFNNAVLPSYVFDDQLPGPATTSSGA